MHPNKSKILKKVNYKRKKLYNKKFIFLIEFIEFDNFFFFKKNKNY